MIGKPEQEKLEGVIRQLEKRLRREVNYTLLSPEEFAARRKKKDPFLEDVWRHKTIRLLTA